MHPSTFDCADVHEDILAAVIRLDEAEALLDIEPLHGSLRHLALLSVTYVVGPRASAAGSFEFWRKVVSPTRGARRGQVVRPKLDRSNVGYCGFDRKGGRPNFLRWQIAWDWDSVTPAWGVPARGGGRRDVPGGARAVKLLLTTLPTNDLGLMTRSLPIAPELAARGHAVAFSNPARAPSRLIAEAHFANILPKHPLHDLIAIDRTIGGLFRMLPTWPWRRHGMGPLANVRCVASAIPRRFPPTKQAVGGVKKRERALDHARRPWLFCQDQLPRCGHLQPIVLLLVANNHPLLPSQEIAAGNRSRHLAGRLLGIRPVILPRLIRQRIPRSGATQQFSHQLLSSAV